jgi:predicted Abi (CAAX) family protease
LCRPDGFDVIKRILSSLKTWPSVRAWAEALAVSMVTVAMIAAIAWVPGLLAWRPDAGALMRLPVILCVPAFTEELVFRGPVPARGETRHPAIWIAASVLIFTLWHVVEASTFLPGARLFLTAPFLVCAAVLALGCAVVRYRTGSLWPPVVLHALVVWVWQSAFGGPSITELLQS